MSSPNTANSMAIDIVKLLIDLPYYVYLLVKAIIHSILLRVSRNRKSLNGETILVTGAAAGLGQQVVWKLAKLFPQAVFVLWDINDKGLTETAKKCQKEFGVLRVRTYTVDLSKREDVVKTAALVRQQVGPVTVLYNNAGIVSYNNFLDANPDVDEAVIRINLLSYMWTIREFLPDMIKSGRGHLISTCSGLGLCRWGQLSSYVASKHGLRGFIGTLELEMRQHPERPNIKFSTVFPAFIKTDMVNDITWEPRYNIRALVPMDPAYVAAKVVDGILREKEEIIVPGYLKLLDLMYRFSPSGLVDDMEKHLYKNVKVSQRSQRRRLQEG